ncbi:hypothetical protein PIB30_013490 [Stylosanthes scabra]|uniref:ADP-ribosyl cyclase/cyclic ADP-ribose hydrolase n=1 Tax=Stylosanthes scabra TaxID=79078 RepID=A0ABU6Z5Z5_9FABA|nr:hypothetical protein [Stylosanthes scabra]
MATKNNAKRYDVFISFRGEDTRNNFTSHLVSAMSEKSIKTYVDFEIERGDEISQALITAIEDSNVSVIVFSQNYASSRWCLHELTKILECKKNLGRVVVPVFYKINPSNVRKQKKNQALPKHDDNEEQYLCALADGKVHQWTAALTEAANLAGWDSRNYRDDADLVKDIVNDILRKLECEYPIEFKDLVGIDENCRSIELLIEKFPVIGIWGMGGIGKTTLAKVVFTKLCSQYESCCFLENVREQSKKHGLNYLHNKLLSELLKEEHPTTSKVVGSTFVMRRLLSKKVLIVLDDVTSFEQLEYLAREFDSFGAGSRVIITTRDKHLLILGRVNEIHEVKELNFQDSLKLFSLNAFKDYFNNPHMEEYKELAERAVVYTKGNPLALKVLGSLFHSKSVEICESVLKKLKKYPNLHIQNVLKLSYDDLDDAEKDIFLDIAFFFVGETKDHAIRILDACDLYATSGIETLQDKALVTILKDNTIQMHDLIQEMGWEIVRQEAIKDPGRRRRLRDTEEVYDGTDAVEGIAVDVSKIQELQLSPDIFKKMTNIRLLKFYAPLNERSCNVHLPLGLESLSHKLRCLEWNGYPSMSLPATFCPENLVVLSMPHSRVKRLWDGAQDLVNLKEIVLYASLQLMELPDLSKASKLEILDVSHCVNLYHVHPSIMSLNKIVDLILYGCKNLKSLHARAIKNLFVNGCLNLKEFSLASKELYMLDLRGTSIETLDKSIGSLSKLDKFYVCESLKHVPKDLPSMTCLRDLSLHNCTQLDDSNLQNLLDASHSVQKLILNGCFNLSEIPHNIKHLSHLEHLSIRDCVRLRHVPTLPPSVGHLDAINCSSLETIVLSSTPPRQIWRKNISISFENCVKLNEHSRISIMEHASVMMKLLASANVDIPETMHTSGTVCLPGSKVPATFKNRTTQGSTAEVELPLPSPSLDLVGLIFCVVLLPFCSNGKYEYHRIVCRWCLEDDDNRVGYTRRWYYKDIAELNSDHVYLWYEASCGKIIEAAKEESKYKCIIGNIKLSFEFYVETYKLSEPKQIGLIGIKECGVCPIHSSECDDSINKIELDHITTSIESSEEMKDKKEEPHQLKNQEKDYCDCLIGMNTS